jgi:hypothetical protein
MAVTRQAYEWRAVVPQGQEVNKTGHPILGKNDLAYTNTFVVPSLEAGHPVDIMWGGKGNNLRTSANTKATQLIIIDGLACWPPQSNINVYVDDHYFFEAPDYSAVNGLSGNMVPFPEPNARNIFTHEAFREHLHPPIIINPLSTWGVFWSPDSANATFVPTSDDQVPRAFVRYFLVDGPDLLIAQQLQKLHLPLSMRNFVKYRQDVLRWHNMGDSHVFRVNDEVDS